MLLLHLPIWTTLTRQTLTPGSHRTVVSCSVWTDKLLLAENLSPG